MYKRELVVHNNVMFTFQYSYFLFLFISLEDNTLRRAGTRIEKKLEHVQE